RAGGGGRGWGPGGPRRGGPRPAGGPAPRAGGLAKSSWWPRFPVRCRGARARAPYLRMTDGGGGAHRAPPPRYPLSVRDGLRRGERLDEHGLTVGADLVQAVRLQRRVAVLVEPVGAEHRRARLDREHGAQDGRLVVALGTMLLDRVHPDLH